MQTYKVMRKKEVRELVEILKKNYGYGLKFRNYVFIKNKEGKIWIANKDLFGSFLKKLKVNGMGMYFGKIKKGGKIKLSIEGSQFIGKDAKRNVVEIDKANAERWIEGKDIFVDCLENCEEKNFVIIKHGEDFLGSGLLKNSRVENLIPKVRRITKTS